jgi:hypothetical protein
MSHSHSKSSVDLIIQPSRYPFGFLSSVALLPHDYLLLLAFWLGHASFDRRENWRCISAFYNTFNFRRRLWPNCVLLFHARVVLASFFRPVFVTLHAIVYQNMYSVRIWFSILAMRTTLCSKVSLWQYTTSQTLHHTTSLLYPRLSSLK